VLIVREVFFADGTQRRCCGEHIDLHVDVDATGDSHDPPEATTDHYFYFHCSIYHTPTVNNRTSSDHSDDGRSPATTDHG
jgi:hypothetical protein